jgi:gamma-glutamyl hercynylcysteine S-oxide synthase
VVNLDATGRVMRNIKSRLVLTLIFLFGLINFGLGWTTHQGLLTVSGAMGVGYAVLMLSARRRIACAASAKLPVASDEPATPVCRAAVHTAIDSGDPDALAAQMLAQQRYSLLLRPQIAANLSETLFQQTIHALQAHAALVPDGEVVLGRIHDDGEPADGPGLPPRVVRVDAFFLDRYPVTNREYYEFVAAGGYEQMALWDESCWLAVFDFVDRTGKPGPRYWRNGCFLPGEERHPVVGVCWYEAAACARWLGKRLPSDAEWVKAGSWPVPVAAANRAQRRFPWGDSMDRSRANLWGSGPDRIVPVDQFAAGVSVGGVYQLIGNVWEWTSGNYRGTDHPSGEVALSGPLKNIRGGAFDTYFDSQAACQFQSGEDPLRRRYNIGFRCAVGVCDLLLARPAPAAAGDCPDSRVKEGDSPVVADTKTGTVPAEEVLA